MHKTAADRCTFALAWPAIVDRSSRGVVCCAPLKSKLCTKCQVAQARSCSPAAAAGDMPGAAGPCRRRAVLACMSCVVSTAIVGSFLLMQTCKRPEASGFSWTAEGHASAADSFIKKKFNEPYGDEQHVRARARRYPRRRWTWCAGRAARTATSRRAPVPGRSC